MVPQLLAAELKQEFTGGVELYPHPSSSTDFGTLGLYTPVSAVSARCLADCARHLESSHSGT